MKIYRGFAELPAIKKKRCIAIGIFDGVHRAHQLILKKTIEAARKSKALSMIVTFEPHPVKILSGNKKNPPILMSLDHRLDRMKYLGLDEALVIAFNKKFAKIPHEDFLHQFLLNKLKMSCLAVGHDFRFGKKALGDTAYLSKESLKSGFKLKVFHPLKEKGHTISSTQIRRLVESGELKKAERMLGRPVSIFGTVVKGRGRGRKLGFPTANIDPHHETLPPSGVYAVTGEYNAKKLFGVLHIGKRPTFGEIEKTVEVHWLDWKGNLYGKDIEVFFTKKLRPIKRFSSPAKLKLAIQKDIRSAGEAFSLYKARIN